MRLLPYVRSISETSSNGSRRAILFLFGAGCWLSMARFRARVRTMTATVKNDERYICRAKEGC